MIYIFSLTLQITGSILLLMWSFSKINKNALEMCFPGINIVERDDNNMCIIKKEILQKNVETIFQNVFAFGCLVFGYLLSIFGLNNQQYLWEKLTIVCILTLLSIIILIKMSRYMSRAWYKNDLIIPYDELENIGVETVATEKEIEDMFNCKK